MTDMISMRHAYGKALAELGSANDRVVALDADVSSSTQSQFFANMHPDRFFNVGIAEPGMVDMAVGLAQCGKIPFVNTFAFLIALRCAEQVRSHLSYGQANVKLAAGYAGLSDSFDGPTHHSITDLAVMRAMPGLAVVAPADSMEMEKLLPQVAEWPGPVYFRISRAEVPVVFDDSYAPEMGKGVLLREGRDATLISTGTMLSRTLAAASQLAGKGIGARVIHFHTLKPLDVDMLVLAARETGALVTVEEHSIIGGLGGAVAETVTTCAPAPVERVGLNDAFAETGPYEELLDAHGLSVETIAAAAERVIHRKRS